jgi:putative transposase
MPRRTRMYIPGLPYHIVQRGNNRNACFIEPGDYRYCLALREQSAPQYGLKPGQMRRGRPKKRAAELPDY